VSEGRRALITRSQPEQSPEPTPAAEFVSRKEGAGSGKARRAKAEKEMFVGIDVSKRTLDVALGVGGELLRIGNEPGAIAALVERLLLLAPQLIVLEASGGYETALVGELGAARLPVAVVNPRPVRELARATGRLEKSDALAARLLALFAERVRPALRELPDAELLELKALMARRRQLVEMLMAEEHRLKQAPKVLHHQLRSHIDYLRKDLHQLNRELEQMLRQSPLWRDKENLLRGVPRCGAGALRHLARRVAGAVKVGIWPDR
jgi:transposase